MDPFVAQVKELCAAYPTHSKWVFVPTHAIGRTLGERIALEGTNWLNVRFVTPLDVALRMGAPFLVERGIDDRPTLAQALWPGIEATASFPRTKAAGQREQEALFSSLTISIRGRRPRPI